MAYNNLNLDEYSIHFGEIQFGDYEFELSNFYYPHGRLELYNYYSGLSFVCVFSEDTNIQTISTIIKNDEIKTKEWANNNGANFEQVRFGTKIIFENPSQEIKEKMFIIHDIQRERTNITDKNSDEALEFIRENINVDITTRSENRRSVVSAISFFSPENNHDENINKIIENYIQPCMPAP